METSRSLISNKLKQRLNWRSVNNGFC